MFASNKSMRTHIICLHLHTKSIQWSYYIDEEFCMDDLISAISKLVLSISPDESEKPYYKRGKYILGHSEQNI